MKKYILIILIISLISFTTFIKNSSKSLENKIYNKKEAIVLLDEAYNLAFLENNYLTSDWYEKLKNENINLKKTKKIFLEDAHY